MATPDSVGTAACCNCNREVFVRKNRGGFAYYRCECCGIAVQHHIMRHSESFLRSKVKLEAGQEQEKRVPAEPQKQERSAVDKFLYGGE